MRADKVHADKTAVIIVLGDSSGQVNEVHINMTGKFATSKAGHDKSRIYIIIREDAEYVYLTDGIYRSVSKPKKKNKKHIQIINKGQDEKITQKLLNKEPVSDEEIKRAIKIYEGSKANV